MEGMYGRTYVAPERGLAVHEREREGKNGTGRPEEENSIRLPEIDSMAGPLQPGTRGQSRFCEGAQIAPLRIP